MDTTFHKIGRFFGVAPKNNLLGTLFLIPALTVMHSCTSTTDSKKSKVISTTSGGNQNPSSSDSKENNQMDGSTSSGNGNGNSRGEGVVGVLGDDMLDADLSCDLKSASKGEVRKITNFELTNALGKTFGVNLLDYSKKLPPELASSGFKNAIISGASSDVYTRKLSDIAPELAQKIMGTDKYKALSIPARCKSETVCGEKFIDELSLLLLSKPLPEKRRKGYEALLASVFHAEQGGMDVAQEAVLIAMIQAPEAVYRIESNSKSRSLDDYEIASRLSFFLWQSRPDELLLADARIGKLVDPVVLEAQIDRMLLDPRAKQSLRGFVSEWFSLDGLNNIQRDPKIFPKFNDGLVSSMREEVLLTMEDLAFESQGSMMSLLKQEHRFIDKNLAELYGIKNFQGAKFKKVSVNENDNRFGLLTMAGILSSLSASDETNPVSRGIFFQDKLLCTEIPPAPPDAGEFEDEGKFDKDATFREKFEEHRRNPSCAACHDKIDPLGLSLEQYNSLAEYRVKYSTGRAIDATGTFETPDGKEGFENVNQLSGILSNHISVSRCMVRKVFQFATGVISLKNSRCQIDHIHEKFKNSNYSYVSLVKAVVLSPSFSTILESI